MKILYPAILMKYVIASNTGHQPLLPIVKIVGRYADNMEAIQWIQVPK